MELLNLSEETAAAVGRRCGSGTDAGIWRGARKTVRTARRRVAAVRAADVSNAVEVEVRLVAVRDGWATVARVENSVVVVVGVTGITSTVDVGVELRSVHC